MNPGGAQDLELLRRRLYSPGATDADRAAYAAAAEPEDQAPAAGPMLRPARRPARRIILLGCAVAVAALGIGIALVPHPRTPRTAPLPSPAAIALYPVERAGMIRDLAAGRPAGIAAYLISRQSASELPGPVPLSIVEGRGTGPGFLRFDGDPLDGGAGRATVLVVLRTAASVTWSADRLIIDANHAVRPTPIRREGGAQAAGELTAATFAFRAGERPVRLRIDVPAGTVWGAAVAVGR